MRNKEQHEGKGKGWACNNHNMRNHIKKIQGGVMHGHTCFTCFSLPNTCSSISCASPTPFAPRSHVKSHAHNNEEMAFVYRKMHVFLALLVQERFYKDSVAQRHHTGEYEAVSCKNEGKYLYHLWDRLVY